MSYLKVPHTSHSRRSHRSHSASTWLWGVIWLIGIALLIFASLRWTVPRLEARLLQGVQTNIAPFLDSSPVMASLRGHEATLTGQVASDEQRESLLDAAASSLGIWSVVDQLTAGGNDNSRELEEDLDTLPPETLDSDDTTVANAASVLATETESQPQSNAQSESAPESESESEPQSQSNAQSDPKQEPEPEPEQQSDSEPSPTAEPESQSNPEQTTETESVPGSTTTAAEDDELPAEDLQVLDVLNSDDTGEQQDNSQLAMTTQDDSAAENLTPPSFSFRIAENALTVSGLMSSENKASPMIREAMQLFDLDYVSNTVELLDTVAPAAWLDPLASLIPELTEISDPSIEVVEQQITLGGSAPSAQVHDEIISAALVAFADFALVEQISIDPNAKTESESESESDADADADADADNAADTEPESSATDSAQTTAQTLAQTSTQTSTQTSAQPTATTADPDTDSPSDTVATANDATDNESATSSATDATQDTSQDTTRNAATEATQDTATDTVAVAPTNSAPDSVSDSVSNTALDTASNAPASDQAGTAALTQALAQLASLDILFQSSRDILTIESLDVLDEIAELFVSHPDFDIRIEGHTDASGPESENLSLSQLRANAVRDYLVDRGVSVYRLKAYGYGEGVPIADNSTPEGRAANRRIEFNY